MPCHEITTIYFGLEITIICFFQPEASLLQSPFIYNYNLNLIQNFSLVEKYACIRSISRLYLRVLHLLPLSFQEEYKILALF